MLSAALLMLVAPVESDTYPAMAVLGAFRSACSDTRNLERLEKSLRKKGWQPLAETVEPRITALVAKGRAAVDDGATLEGNEYSQKVNGRTLYLVTSRVTDTGGASATGCRVYDIDAKMPIRDEILQKWMKKPPTHRENLSNGATIRKWEPAWRKGVTTDASFAGVGGEFNEKFGLSGVILTAQSIGGF